MTITRLLIALATILIASEVVAIEFGDKDRSTDFDKRYEEFQSESEKYVRRKPTEMSDFKKWCIGVTKTRDSCYAVKKKSYKNACLGMSRNSDLCFLIDDTDIKSLCLGTTKSRNNCYLIGDRDIKNTCLGITQNSDVCHLAKGEWKQFCLARTGNSDLCYILK